MNKIWTFGDSFTEFFSEQYEWSREYIKWKGYKPKVYGEILSERLGLKLINKGLGGSSNQRILGTICENLNKIQPGDVVVIGWSFVSRFRLVDETNVWRDILLPENMIHPSVGDVSGESIVEILINRTHINYAKEVDYWIRLIDRALKDCHVVHWMFSDENVNVPIIRLNETIDHETDGLINDTHYNERGHIIVAEKILDLINQNKKLI
jgi:hypothetical protein